MSDNTDTCYQTGVGQKQADTITRAARLRVPVLNAQFGEALSEVHTGFEVINDGCGEDKKILSERGVVEFARSPVPLCVELVKFRMLMFVYLFSLVSVNPYQNGSCTRCPNSVDT